MKAILKNFRGGQLLFAKSAKSGLKVSVLKIILRGEGKDLGESG
jgi:hypothetical protein